MLGGYRDLRIVATGRRLARSGHFYSVESVAGEISGDGVSWRPFVKPLWRRIADGSEAFTGWWDLARSGGMDAAAVMLCDALRVGAK